MQKSFGELEESLNAYQLQPISLATVEKVIGYKTKSKRIHGNLYQEEIVLGIYDHFSEFHKQDEYLTRYLPTH